MQEDTKRNIASVLVILVVVLCVGLLFFDFKITGPEKQEKTEEKEKKKDKEKEKDEKKDKDKEKEKDKNKNKDKEKKEDKDKKKENELDDHEHTWVEKVVHHDEKGHYDKVEVQPAWDEEELHSVNVCDICGAVLEGDISAHMEQHGGGGYHAESVPTGNIIHHDAVYEEQWVVDEPAWDEVYLECSQCGKRK